MPLKARSLALTESQAACLIALRNGKVSKPEIAIQAKLDLIKTATALGALARLRLAKQNQAKRWHTTTRGKHVASRSFRIDCGETAGFLAPAGGGCSNY
jgi:hypothetical protein